MVRETGGVAAVFPVHDHRQFKVSVIGCGDMFPEQGAVMRQRPAEFRQRRQIARFSGIVFQVVQLLAVPFAVVDVFEAAVREHSPRGNRIEVFTDPLRHHMVPSFGRRQRHAGQAGRRFDSGEGAQRREKVEIGNQPFPVRPFPFRVGRVADRQRNVHRVFV